MLVINVVVMIMIRIIMQQKIILTITIKTIALHIIKHLVLYNVHSTYNKLCELIKMLSSCGLQHIVPAVNVYSSIKIIERDMLHIISYNIKGQIINVRIIQYKLNIAELMLNYYLN